MQNESWSVNKFLEATFIRQDQIQNILFKVAMTDVTEMKWEINQQILYVVRHSAELQGYGRQ